MLKDTHITIGGTAKTIMVLLDLLKCVCIANGSKVCLTIPEFAYRYSCYLPMGLVVYV